MTLTAPAAQEPCALYKDHGSAVPSVTQGHHIHPLYLQERKYSEVRDEQVLYLCGTCHDNVHAWLYALMGERRRPDPIPPARARALAEAALEWYATEE